MAALRTRPAGVRPIEGDLYEAATRLGQRTRQTSTVPDNTQPSDLKVVAEGWVWAGSCVG
jgi:hypothetical protein